MATQDFSSGGFIGRLGAVVGYKKGEKYIMYPYFKPKNPNTELQQEKRQKFAFANEVTRTAYNLNKGNGGFNEEGKQEYTQRLQYALSHMVTETYLHEYAPVFYDITIYPAFCVLYAGSLSGHVLTAYTSFGGEWRDTLYDLYIMYKSRKTGRIEIRVQPLFIHSAMEQVSVEFNQLDGNEDVDWNYIPVMFGWSKDSMPEPWDTYILFTTPVYQG